MNDLNDIVRKDRTCKTSNVKLSSVGLQLKVVTGVFFYSRILGNARTFENKKCFSFYPLKFRK